MSNDTECDIQKDIKLYLAVLRHKDNPGTHEKCYRAIKKDDSTLSELKNKIMVNKDNAGVWRIYETINSRDTIKAQNILMHKLLDNPVIYSYRIDSLWRTCLLQRECRIENNYMLDIDYEIQSYDLENIYCIIGKDNIIKHVITPSGGSHIVVRKMSKEIYDYCQSHNIEIKKDGYVFIEHFVVK